ncbi:TPA: YjbQ family protein [Candidatus Micrarchaeota archaeon]|nr:YjbQ family protein [Candidatus Micrarchaeota archaeon]
MLKEIRFRTQRKEQAVDITEEVQGAIRESGIKEGFVFIYVPHATAAVSIHRYAENPDSILLEETLKVLKPGPEGEPLSKAAFVAPTEVGIVKDGKMILGDDQRIYFYEFDGPKDRVVYVYVGS